MPQTNSLDTRVEFIIHENGTIEVCYFDNPKDGSCFSWKLPRSVIGELVRWWMKFKKDRQITFPLSQRNKKCEFTMCSEKYVEINEIDSRGRTNMTGWSLPVVVVEQLLIWQRDKAKRRD